MRLIALATLGLALIAGSLCAACGGAERPSKYPPRPEGCDVTVSEDAPGGATDNIGPVSASCADSVSDDECLRTLKDQVCKLGGDALWGTDGRPKLDLGRKRLDGRAAKRR